MVYGFEQGVHIRSVDGKARFKGDGRKCPPYTGVVISLTIARRHIAK